MKTFEFDGLDLDQHGIFIESVGWGEPQSMRAQCVCGWGSISIEERAFDEVNPDFSIFPEPFRSIAETFGPDSLLQPHQAWGNRDSVIRLALEHLAYEPELDLTAREAEWRAAARACSQASLDEAEMASARVEKAGTAVKAALKRNAVWREVTLPQPAKPEAEALAIIERARQNTRGKPRKETK